MKIGELARTAQAQSETIRYYERAGLMPQAARTEANYRVYDGSDVERLAFIRQCRLLDMTLGEIRTLLQFKDAPQENCTKVDALLDAHIGHVVTRIGELKRLKGQLKALRKQCTSGHAGTECGILSGLEDAARQQGRRPNERVPAAHIHGTHQQISGVIGSKRI